MPQSIQSYYPEKTRDANFGSGTSVSQAFAVGSGTLVGLDIPSGWTAAAISFQGSQDGVHWNPLYDSTGAEITFTVAASTKVLIDHLDGNAYLKLVSGTNESQVNQVSAVTVVCSIKKPTGGFLGGGGF